MVRIMRYMVRYMVAMVRIMRYMMRYMVPFTDQALCYMVSNSCPPRENRGTVG